MLKINTFLASLRKSENTKLAYSRTLNDFQKFLRAATLTTKTASAYLNHLQKKGLKASSIARHGHALRRYCKWAKIPLEIELPTAHRRIPQWLDKDEIHKLIDACSNLLETVIVFVLLDTGIRISELLNLKVEDIDWTGFLFIRRKGGREGYCPIGDKALKVLAQYIDECKIRNIILQLTYHQVRRILNDLGRRAGMRIRVNAHLLRHSRASQLRLDGVAIEDIQQLLGHANIQTTMIYSHLKPKDLQGRLKPIL